MNHSSDGPAVRYIIRYTLQDGQVDDCKATTYDADDRAIRTLPMIGNKTTRHVKEMAEAMSHGLPVTYECLADTLTCSVCDGHGTIPRNRYRRARAS